MLGGAERSVFLELSLEIRGVVALHPPAFFLELIQFGGMGETL